MSALPCPVGGKQWVLTTEPKGFFITEEMKNILYQHDLALSNDVVNFEVDSLRCRAKIQLCEDSLNPTEDSLTVKNSIY